MRLIAKSESCGGQTRPYASGIVTTVGHFTYTYGYIEARAYKQNETFEAAVRFAREGYVAKHTVE